MSISRRHALSYLAGASALAWAPRLVFAARPKPDWAPLARMLGDVLQPVHSPLVACVQAGGAGADNLFKSLANPYYLGDEPALTQTLGWVDAWTSRPSEQVVVAQAAAHVATAVDFARKTGVKLVVKGGGHSYFGNSNAPDSLLVWTRRMQAIDLHDAFRPQGAPSGTAPLAAVSVGAGCIWGRVYKAVAVDAGRYVQGGGCLTVGVAGFATGGGFGSFSKAYGTGASNLLEAEVVTADGKVRIVNAHRDPDLFFALRGGGGGTFGIVTRLTMRTHKLPSAMGAVIFSVTAASDAAWRRLVARVMGFYATALFNPNWGEQMRFDPDRTLSVSMLFQDLSEAQARAAWQPFLAWLAASTADYKLRGDPVFLVVPGGNLWNPDILRTVPGVVLPDTRAGAPAGNIFWATNLSETAQILNAYQSAWMPADLLQPERQASLVEALIAGSARWGMALHMNKGLAGGASDAIARTLETATNPQVTTAFALLICAADAPPAYPGIAGHEPDVAKGRREAARVTAAMQPIRALVPGAGAYVSESDYFQPDWQRAYWGDHYPRLLAIKRRYDPTGLFSGRNTVGSR